MTQSVGIGAGTELRTRPGQQLTRVLFAVGWDPAERRGLGGLLPGGSARADLDSLCLVYGADGRLLDRVDVEHIRSRDTSIVHSGDNPTGDGAGDDELIYVDLRRIDDGASALFFVVKSVNGKPFHRIRNAFARLVDKESGSELVRYDLTLRKPDQAQLVGKLYRRERGWAFLALGEPVAPEALEAAVVTYL